MEEKPYIRYSFPKREKLTSKKTIEGLFKNGSSFYLTPFLLKYEKNLEQDNHRIVIAVSKKNFKRAVDRNLIKRRIREAYRMRKHTVQTPFLNLAIIYTGNVILQFRDIEIKLSSLLKRLEKIRVNQSD